MESLADEVKRLKRARGALLLAHNYVPADVQDAADFVGDSLELSLRARDARVPVIVFCGVAFMAETAKILSPASRVLHPDPSAGCPMADMAKADAVARYRQEHPEAAIVAYVNTTAAVKAESDICCTSANAARVVQSIPPDRDILFLPDRNLGANVSRETGRPMDLWPGFCPTHNQIFPESVLEARRNHPKAVFLAHPECLPDVVALADHSLSTGGMIRFARESAETEFIIGTEGNLLHRLRRGNPGKTFYGLFPEPQCPNMKKITLETVLWALRDNEPAVEPDADVLRKARRPIERMLALRER